MWITVCDLQFSIDGMECQYPFLSKCEMDLLLFIRRRALAARHPANSVMGRASSPSPSGDFSMGWMRYSSRPVGP